MNLSKMNKELPAGSTLLHMRIDPYMNPLRDDPRFQEVLKKAGFPNTANNGTQRTAPARRR
jgi:hypothetical protein